MDTAETPWIIALPMRTITFIRGLPLRAVIRVVLGVVTCAATVVTNAVAHAQTIELTREIEPPTPGKPSLGAALVGVLEREAGELKSSAAAIDDAAARIMLEARANWRLLAAELLASGDREGAAGSAAWLNGLKLTVNRESLDLAVTAIIAVDAGGGDEGDAGNAEVRNAAIEALANFNRAFIEHVQSAGGAKAPRESTAQTQPNANGVSEWIAPLLSRLIPAIIPQDASTWRTHWIAAPGAAGVAGATSVPQVSDDLAALRARAERTAMDDLTRAGLMSIIEFLERGRQFAELGPRIDAYQRTISELLMGAEVIAISAWLGDDQRDAMNARLSRSVAWFQDIPRRQQGIDAMLRLEAEASVLTAIDALAQSKASEKALHEVVAGVWKSVDEAKSDRDAVRMLKQATAIIERMTAARTLSASGLARELRIVERELQKDYRLCEAKVLAELASGAILKGSMADPGISSLLADLRERVDDLVRLRRMPDWSVAINQIHPPAAKDFDVRMRKHAQALLEPAKRVDARIALDRFEDELRMFERMPFEKSLRDAATTAVQLTGGLNAQMIGLITEKRKAWADAWSRVEFTPEASTTMLLLHQLCGDLRDAASLVEIEADTLNRWPAWQVSAELVAAGQGNVVTRLRLACAAAANGDLISLREQVDRIDRESPLAKLAGRLMHGLGNDMRERSDGAAGLLAQLTIGPADDALFIRHRDDLAKVCRYAAEAEHARGAGQGDAAVDCQGYVDALATRLLERLAKE